MPSTDINISFFLHTKIANDNQSQTLRSLAIKNYSDKKLFPEATRLLLLYNGYRITIFQSVQEFFLTFGVTL